MNNISQMSGSESLAMLYMWPYIYIKKIKNCINYPPLLFSLISANQFSQSTMTVLHFQNLADAIGQN